MCSTFTSWPSALNLLAHSLFFLSPTHPAPLSHPTNTNTENRKLLQSDYLGYRSRFNVEAPQATRFAVGAATGASGPAEFRERTSLTGPNPPSAAFGVNPTGGFAEYKDTTRFDATLPRYSGVFRASQANTWAADLSAGTRLLPDFQSSTKIHPTMPLTFPVFSLGGSILPTPTYQAVINPPRGVLGAPAPAPKAKGGAGGKDGAPEGKEGGGGDDKDGGRRWVVLFPRSPRVMLLQAPSFACCDVGWLLGHGGSHACVVVDSTHAVGLQHYTPLHVLALCAACSHSLPPPSCVGSHTVAICPFPHSPSTHPPTTHQASAELWSSAHIHSEGPKRTSL